MAPKSRTKHESMLRTFYKYLLASVKEGANQPSGGPVCENDRAIITTFLQAWT